MEKALIICATEISPLMMASRTTDFPKQKGEEVLVDAVSATEGDNMTKNSDFDLPPIGPQATMLSDKPKKLGEPVGKLVVSIPLQAYVPAPTGIQKLARVVEGSI